MKCKYFETKKTVVIKTPDFYTCITCQVLFKTADLQKEHYKLDWHRYNLNRKVASILPVTLEEFEKRAKEHKESAEAVRDESAYCTYCSKLFNTKNAYNNHLNSKKHKQAEEKSIKEGNDDHSNHSDTESFVKIDNVDNLPIKNEPEKFVVVKPVGSGDEDIETDSEIEEISQGYMCLWCNETGRTFYSLEAARGHMIDKGHCKMLHEGLALAEYADFYDYSSSYPDHKEGEENMDVDNEVEEPANLEESDYQLVLPSGVLVGHRSLMRYYKQNLTHNSQVLVKKSDRKLHRLLGVYKALGWAPKEQALAAKKARDIHFMKRVQAKWQMKLSLKSNKFQKHYRPQVNF
ncbi:zinc finger protein 622 isoform X2 [Papilio machaon]|uniref:zinc finger protein 622 isoform X2 n=1 Tax=Papilio machaon TaxID=76193 RepID=UPI001E6655EE|nr:zinc finger protein 622 isoform X2 [Papilio machaon]